MQLCGRANLAYAWRQVEGTCNGKYGFILCVMQSTDVGKGIIREGMGSATFTVKYTCVAFLPHKGEVLDTIVTSVNKVCARECRLSAWARVGLC